MDKKKKKKTTTFVCHRDCARKPVASSYCTIMCARKIRLVADVLKIPFHRRRTKKKEISKSFLRRNFTMKSMAKAGRPIKNNKLLSATSHIRTKLIIGIIAKNK